MNDKLAIAWCDNGMVDGKFMQGVTDVMLHSGVEVVTTLRSQGNQIARQRDRVRRQQIRLATMGRFRCCHQSRNIQASLG